MSLSNLVNEIYDFFVRFIPFFRVGWVITILIGAFLLVLAFILKKNPKRKKSPWIVGGFGILAMISSSVQLLFSFA